VAAGRGVAVVDVGAHRLTLIDAVTLKPITSIPAGAGPTHAVADAAGNVYVVDTGGDALDVFATTPRLRLRARIPLPGTPYGIAIDRLHRRLWVTLTATNQLVELSLVTATPRRLARYRTARQPNTVAVDPRTGTVFVADAAAGAVQIIRPPG
jgi:DNA-binding beta-propeller fold protein YncE